MKYLNFFLLLNILFFIQLTSVIAQTQSRIDSLENLIKTSEGKEKINATINLGSAYEEIDQAIAYNLFKKALKQAKKEGLDYQIGMSYYSLATMRFLNLEIDSAFKLLELAKISFRHIESIDYHSRIYHLLGEIHLSKGEYSYALSSIDTAINIIAKDIKLDKAPILITKAKIMRHLGKSRESLNIYFEALTNLKSESSFGEVLMNIGNVYNAISKYDSAIIYYDSSLIYREKENDIKGMALIKLNQGTIYYFQSEFEKALEYYQEASKLFEDVKSDNYQAISNLNSAMVCKQLKRFGFAEELYLSSLSLFIKQKLLEQECLTRNSLATLYIDTDDLEKAKKQLFILLDVSKKKNYKVGLLNAHTNLGELYLKKSAYEKSFYHLDTALSNAKLLNDSNRIGQIAICISKLFLKVQKTPHLLLFKKNGYPNKRVIILVKKALVNSKRIGNKLHYIQLSYLQIELLLKENKNDEALELIEGLSLIQDSIFSDNVAEKISEFETKFKTQQKEQQITLQNAQLEAQKAQIKSRNLTIVAGGASVLFLLLIGGVYQKKRKEKRKAQNKIDSLNEKYTAVEHLRNKISQDLHDSVGSKMKNLATQISNISVENKNELLQELKVTTNEIRSLSYKLYPVELENLGLKEAIKTHLTKLNHISDVNFSLQILPENCLEKLSKNQNKTIYRIIQESTTNVLEHAKANQVEIQLTEIENQLLITIEDDGIGFDKSLVNEGSGLINIKKRCEDLNANLNIDSKLGEGCTIHISIES